MTAAHSRKKKRVAEADTLIGQRVKARRMELGVSQEKLGQAIGVTFQQIQKYERGDNRISASRLQDISDHLKIDLAYFLDGASQAREKTSLLAAFFSSKDGVDIGRAMLPLSRNKRRSVIQLARSLGDSAACK